MQDFVNRVARSLAVYMLLALTAERVVSVWRPVEFTRLCTHRLSHLVAAFFFVTTCIFYSHEALGPSVFCPGVKLTLCPADLNPTLEPGAAKEGISDFKRDLQYVLSHYAFTPTGTVPSLRDMHARDIISLREGDFHWSEGGIQIKRPLSQRKTHYSALADADVLNRRGSGEVYARQHRPIGQNSTSAGSDTPGDATQTIITKGKASSARTHHQALKLPKRKRLRRASNSTQHPELPESDNGASVGGSAGSQSAARTAASCNYLHFYWSSWPIVDALVTCFIPLFLLITADVAVAYKVFFTTAWAFPVTTEGGARMM